MAYRVVLIESEVTIHLKLNNIIINKGEGDIWIPLDDVYMIVIDNLKIEITARMLSTLAEHNVGVIICNQEHLPIGFYSSYDNHSRISKNIGYQINKDDNFYESLWTNIVRHKINNQLGVLKRLNIGENIWGKLNELSEQIVLGDTTNREAHGAKIYFNSLMNSTFSRGNEDILLNSGLDYGYAIIRSYIARTCVGYGLNSQLGIHHKNEFNRFNLVDDLIEPIRPFVDYYAYVLLKDEEYFKPEHRRKLINLLNHKVKYRNKEMYMCNMIEEYVEQYASYIMERGESIEFPDISGYIEENYGV